MEAAKLRWVCLASASAAMLAGGLDYSWSLFSASLAEEFGWGDTALAFNYTLIAWDVCFGGIVGARMLGRYGVRTTERVAGALVLIGLCLAALTVHFGIGMLYLSYGVVASLGLGMNYNANVSVLAKWFPDRIGFSSGVLLCCYGCSALVLGPAVSYLFSSVGWRWAFLALGMMVFAAFTLNAFVLREPTPSQIDELSLRCNQASSTDEKAAPRTRSCTPREMLKEPAFYLFFLWITAFSTIGLGVVSQAEQIAVFSGMGKSLAVASVGILSFCNGVGRLFVGSISDGIGRTRCMAIVSGLFLAGILLLFFGARDSSPGLVFAAFVCVGFGVSGTPTMQPGFVGDRFGGEHYATNLSIVNLNLLPSSLAGPMLLSTSVAGTSSYVSAIAGFFAVSVVAVCGLACLTLYDSRRRARCAHAR